MSTSTSTSTSQVKVWDPLVRIFHWALVSFYSFSYILTYFEGDDVEIVHVWSGYTIASLISFRLIWGFIGSKYARFSHFVKSPRVVIDYLKQIKQGHPKRHLGHNPAGGAMIVALISSLVLTVLCGLTLIAIDGNGPFAQTFLANLPEDPMEDIHSFFANFTLALIALHVLGVKLASKQHNENLIKAMFTGLKNKL